MKTVSDAIPKDIKNLVEEYQTKGKVNIELKIEDSKPTVKILKDVGIPGTAIYVYKENPDILSNDYPISSVVGASTSLMLFRILWATCPETDPLTAFIGSSILAFIPGYMVCQASKLISDEIAPPELKPQNPIILESKPFDE
jgi:hypothetical protein